MMESMRWLAGLVVLLIIGFGALYLVAGRSTPPQLAIEKPAPYQPFPKDMRRMLDNDYREVRFAFYYN